MYTQKYIYDIFLNILGEAELRLQSQSNRHSKEDVIKIYLNIVLSANTICTLTLKGNKQFIYRSYTSSVAQWQSVLPETGWLWVSSLPGTWHYLGVGTVGLDRSMMGAALLLSTALALRMTGQIQKQISHLLGQDNPSDLNFTIVTKNQQVKQTLVEYCIKCQFRLLILNYLSSFFFLQCNTDNRQKLVLVNLCLPSSICSTSLANASNE